VQAIPPKAAPRTDIVAAAAINRSTSAMSAPAAAKPAERAWVELAGQRLMRILGSLQLAVILLMLFAGAVVLGTLIESAYTQKIAQELVYRSWWFVFLLAMLSVNIFFAAAKKWPWKRHQTGFVITHIGLITMLAGGILNGLWGTDATVALVDTNDLQVLAELRDFYGHLTQSSSHYVCNETHQLTIATKDKSRQEDFEGGPLPWHAGTDLRVGRDPWLVVLNALQSPFGRGWSVDLDAGDKLEAINYLPSASYEPYSPAREGGVPAFKVRLQTPRQPAALEHWLALTPGKQWPRNSGMPVLTEIIGFCPTGLLTEFLQPPSAKELGPKGILVIRVGGQNYRFSVEDGLKKGDWVDVGKTGMQVKINEFVPDLHGDKEPKYPLVKFEWKQGNEAGKCEILARFTGRVFDPDQRGGVDQGDAAPRLYWYHPPDMRWGNERLKGVLDFVLGSDGKLYYREFAGREKDGKAEFVCASSGRAEQGQDQAIWTKMNFRFRVGEFLPHAVEQARYLPIDAVPGKESEADKMRATPAIQFRLTDKAGTKQDFWVGMGRGETVQVGTRQYQIRFGQKQLPLGFELKLERAEQTVDPGTRAAATYSSFVEVMDPKHGINGKKEEITMNKPLQYGGFTFYQSNYTPTRLNDAVGRPVSISGFTVSNDPGIALKYLGSIFLSLGIILMFYFRKAYFFQPRRRPALATASGPVAPDGPIKENDA
jgi:hypothetical protein